MEKKITKATLKSFIAKNRDGLFINVKSEFDGYSDGLESRGGGFVKAEADDRGHCQKNTLGIEGLWIVGNHNTFEAYDDGIFTGIEYMNCCGHGIVAIRKAA
jgi:hypothetical protein